MDLKEGFGNGQEVEKFWVYMRMYIILQCLLYH